jgi:hypothetical protein
MARIAQAYFHFHTRLSEKELRQFGHRVDHAARQAAIRNFKTAVLINVEIEEGSLIGRVTALAALVAIYTGLISDYKGVKDGIMEMCKDARSFGLDVCTKAIDLAGISNKQVYRIERRTKTVGKLGRLLTDVERLEKSIDDLTPTQMRNELNRLNHELQTIARDLDQKENEALGKVLEKTRLPLPNRWPTTDAEEPKAIVKPEQFELEIDRFGTEATPRRIYRPQQYESSFKVAPRKDVK